MRKFFILFTVLFSGALQTVLIGQVSHGLAFYVDVMINAEQPQHRLEAQAQVHQRLRTILQQPGAREMTFDSLRGIQIIVPEDSTFRLFTWQLMVSDSQYQYFGFIQPMDDRLPFVELTDSRTLRSEYTAHNQDTWYGALYYGVTVFEDAGGAPRYLLLGFNANDSGTNIKVADVMQYSDRGVQFGGEMFVYSDSLGTDIKSRIILEYADATAGRMQFDRERGILAFDHVITIFTDGPEAGPLQVPDGSYHGYELREGKWYFIDKLFHTTVDEPPGDARESDEVERDIFGRPVKDR